MQIEHIVAYGFDLFIQGRKRSQKYVEIQKIENF